MFSSRKEFVKKINEKYGLDISVDFSSIWKQNRLEAEYELESLKAESQPEESSQLEEKGDEEVETNETGDTGETGETGDTGEPEESGDIAEETNEEETSEEAESTDETAEESSKSIVEIDIQVNADNIESEEEEGVEDAGSETGEEEDK